MIPLDDVRATARAIEDHVLETPVVDWRARGLAERLPDGATVSLKLELLQVTGSFKPRGAVANALALDADARARGVTAMSAGNHAIATAYAARAVGAHARVVMLESASPVRVERCRALGAEVLLAPTAAAGFELASEIAEREGRTLIHPFEGELTARGTGTVALEWLRADPAVEALVIPIGGGGLIAGIANAAKQLAPSIRVYGVEPEGADSMTRSLAAGTPQRLDAVRTIADSLGAPYAAPYSFALCQEFVDDVVLVSDDDLREGLRLLFDEAKLAAEPAAAASIAAVCGPLRDRLAGMRVGVIACGANIDPVTFARHLGVV